MTLSNQSLKKEIQSLMSGARIFQANKCANCNLPLELPAVHFLCGHSYHLSCLPEENSGCSRCAYKFKWKLWRGVRARPYLTLAPAPTEEEFYRAVRERGGDDA